MLRTLRAFAWMRWRILVNSLERTGARDRLERFSVAVEQLGPIMAAVLMIPSAIALAGIGAAGGYALGAGNARPMLLGVTRYMLLAAIGLSIVGPLLLPAADRTNAVRLLLLPISRQTLYAAQAAATLTDPWVLLVVPLVIFIPIGLAVAGAPASALVSLVAGVLLLATIVGVSALATSVLHVIVRNRRRGELLALAFVLLMPMLGVLPAVLGSTRDHEPSGRGRHAPPPAWVTTNARRAGAVVPSELYMKATGVQFGDEHRSPVRPLGVLAVLAVGLHAAGLFVFGKVLDSPGTTSVRRTHATRAAWGGTLPLLSPGASAVAMAQLRLALRSPRGRSTLLSPLIVFAMFTLFALRAGDVMDVGVTTLRGGIGFASFGCFISLIATLPIAMNQFAVDGAGLTLALLSPLTNRELLHGKAVGNAFIAAIPTVVCLAGGLIVFGGGSVAEWLSIPLAMLATYAIAAPLAGIFSAVFPRAVDMNSIGRGSNAHGLAGLLGMAAFVGGGAPAVLLVLLASSVLQRPSLAPLLLLIWCVVALLISWPLFSAAERILERRRENLALVV